MITLVMSIFLKIQYDKNLLNFILDVATTLFRLFFHEISSKKITSSYLELGISWMNPNSMMFGPIYGGLIFFPLFLISKLDLPT